MQEKVMICLLNPSPTFWSNEENKEHGSIKPNLFQSRVHTRQIDFPNHYRYERSVKYR